MLYVLKMVCKFGRIGCAKKRAINGEQPQSVPEVILIFLLSPVACRQGEELPKRFIAQPLACLGNGTGSESLTFLRTQDEVEFFHNVRDGAVAVQAHTHNQPDHEFCGEFTFTDTGFIRGIKNLRNPLKGNGTLKTGK